MIGISWNHDFLEGGKKDFLKKILKMKNKNITTYIVQDFSGAFKKMSNLFLVQ